ncbi:unnamed protein product [Mytilus coruscus]|uniref:Uncharacterized protein n=1 Tax=Mytilus coruscus TaxID=42192 RepID=A0A6J8DRW4_MYTCO|nr:unnamed protein product [Mytilus coruscus]
MDHLQEFFLENQRDLDRESQKSPQSPPPECEHQWERVLIYGTDPAYICGRCGAERYARCIDDQDFEGRNFIFPSRRKPRRPSGPPCCIKTVRGHQCTYPSILGSDKCRRHLRLFPKTCHRCRAPIARGKAFASYPRRDYSHTQICHTMVRRKSPDGGEYDNKSLERMEPFCSSKCMESA